MGDERDAAREVEHFRRVEALFDRASELPEHQRAAFLNAECGDDAALRAEVADLLGFDSDAESRLGAAVGAGLEWIADGPPPPPERLGPYRVIEEIGRGGLGTVYLGERDDAQFRMQVAIKVVRPEMRTPELERRLRRERQILAGLDHPNIARILDGGTAEDGAPYLVMERVDGELITDYVRRARLSTRRRIELFRTVCDAVHFAHRNLVLHRDLKPSNILVADGDVPKLLDFGIAKVLHGDAPEVLADGARTLTRPGMRPLTPEYASPEQVLDQPLTTGSDVYSLGVLLYELITDERPYTIDDPRPTEIERIVCTVEPERPRVIARRRGERPAWGEDLDNIVAMALRKEPERRYASVEQLSEDLRRYLHDLPVLARRDSVGYRTVKFLRRHRVPVVAAALVLATLVAAVVVTSQQARVADRERQRAEASLALAEEQRQSAEEQRRSAEEVADFLVDLFEISDPSRSRGATVTAREVLDQGAKSLSWNLRDRPQLRTTLMTTIGRVYRQLGLLDASNVLLAEALNVRRRDLPDEDPDVVVGLRELGLLRWEQGAFDKAEALLREGLDLERQHRGDTVISSEILQDLAGILAELGDATARDLLDEALAIRRRAFGEDSVQVAETRDRLAQALYAAGELTDAEALARQALASRRAAWGDDHPDIARSLNNLAAILQVQGDVAAAAELFEEALAQRRRLYGDQHGAVVQALTNLATSHAAQRDWSLATTTFRDALAAATKVYGDDHAMVADIHYNIARLSLMQGDFEAAARSHERALAIRERCLGEAHPETAQSLTALATAVVTQDPTRAEQLYRRAVDLQREHLPADDPRRTYPLLHLGKLVCKQDPTEGARLLREAWELRRAQLGDTWQTWVAESALAHCSSAFDPSAADRMRAVIERLEEALGANDARARRERERLAEIDPG